MQTQTQHRKTAKSLPLMLIVALLASIPLSIAPTLPAQMSAAPAPPALGTGVLPPAEVERLLPASVYYRGQSAPLQLRNAAAFRSSTGGLFWVSLVDTSGYSTGVRDRYQFYLVTEQPLSFGTATLPAGAYGCGFLSDGTALVTDLGGHDVTKTPLITDAAFRRPRPLQLVAAGDALRLYVGRQYVTVAVQ